MTLQVDNVSKYHEVGKSNRESDIIDWIRKMVNFKASIFDMPFNMRSAVAQRLKRDGYSIDRFGYIDWKSIVEKW